MNADEPRKRKLEELKQKYLEEKEAEQRELEAEAQLQLIIRKLLDDAARERLNNIKLVNRELYLRAGQAIIYLYEAGQLSGRIDEEQLKQLLSKLNVRKEVKITRK